MEMTKNFLKENMEGITKLFFALWNVWKARNEAAFEDKLPRPIEVLTKVNILSSEFLNCLAKKQGYPNQDTNNIPPMYL